MLKKLSGLALILAVLSGLFLIAALEHGFVTTALTWGAAIGITAILAVGIKLLMDD